MAGINAELLDPRIYDKIDTGFAQRLGNIFDPNVNAERNNKLADLMNERNMNLLKMKHAQDDVARQKIMQGREDTEYAMKMDALSRLSKEDQWRRFNGESLKDIKAGNLGMAALQNYNRDINPTPVTWDSNLNEIDNPLSAKAASTMSVVSPEEEARVRASGVPIGLMRDKTPDELASAAYSYAATDAPHSKVIGAQQKFKDEQQAKVEAARILAEDKITAAAEAHKNRLKDAFAKSQETSVARDRLNWEMSGGGEKHAPVSVVRRNAEGKDDPTLGAELMLRSQAIKENRSLAGTDAGIQGGLATARSEGRETGEGAAKAKLALPGAQATKTAVNKHIDEILSHPGFESYVGMTLLPFASKVEGTPEADVKSRIDQLEGGAFLDAFTALKGGGAISVVEGEKATNAIIRMKKSTSEAAFKLAAQDYKDAIERGFEKLEAQSKMGQSRRATDNSGAAKEETWIRDASGKLVRK